MNVALVRLALQRAFPPAFGIGTLAILVLAALFAGQAPAGEEALFSTLRNAPDAHLRLTVWGLVLWIGLPVMIARAARAAALWRGRDADWFAPLPRPPALYGASVLSGNALGVVLLGASALLVTELLADGGAGPRLVHSLEHPELLAVEGERGIGWTQTDLDLGAVPAGARIVLRPTVAPGSGPAVRVRATLEDVAGRSTAAETLLYGRGELVLDVPAEAEGEARFTVERLGPGAILALPRGSMHVLAPSYARAGGLELLLRLALAGLAWTALATGLGCLMRPALAAGVTFALASIPHWSASLTWVPGGDLLDAWQLLGEGVVPRALTPAQIGSSLAVLLVSGFGFTRGLGGGRSEP